MSYFTRAQEPVSRRGIRYSVRRTSGGIHLSRIVCKFGGTSLADAARIRQVAKIVRSDPSRRFVVLSAPGKRDADDVKVTDLLYRMIEHGEVDRSIFSRIFQRYAVIRDTIAPDFDLEAEFAQFWRHDPQDTDYFASRGEAILAKLFAAYTGWSFVDAAELLLFDESGRIDREASARACVENLLPLDHAVIPGFYGQDAGGRIRVFPRGGSDVSGAWITAFLRADLYENWTDVNGLYSADPTLVDSAVHIPCVDYSRAEAVLRAGAAVLDPDAIAPLHEAGIECRIRNTFAPEAASTRICACGDRAFPCVTGQENLYMIPVPSVDGSDVMLYRRPVDGSIPVAAVCAFGLTAEQLARIRSEIQPVHIIHMQEQVKIIVGRGKYVETLRFVHETLTGKR